MRVAGYDRYGNPWTVHPGDPTGSPLRCCLRMAEPGEPVTLIAWSPATVPGPYAEVGPVFVHHEACAGYRTPHRYPDAFHARRQILRCYRADGTQDYHAHREIIADEDIEAAVLDRLAVPGVSTVHVRNVLAGCFMLAARSAA